MILLRCIVRNGQFNKIIWVYRIGYKVCFSPEKRDQRGYSTCVSKEKRDSWISHG
jgi:hypothetical protein